MTTTYRVRMLVTGLLVAAAAVMVSADTLVFRDGHEVRGQLVAVRNGMIEFQERGGFGGRTLRVSRDEVRRIEIEDFGPGGDDRAGRGWGGRRGGMREREVRVSADRPWTDTGIDVRDGQVVYFEARGEIVWGPGREDGPQGERNSSFNAGRPIPNRPGGSLIGRVGPGRDVFFIGNERDGVRVRGDGRLFLGVNDDYLQDNRGFWTVTVSY
jgi:hypothetical protein